MQRLRSIAFLFGLLALWMQLVAPALALTTTHDAFDPRAAICGKGAGERGDHRRDPTPAHAACDHCVLCQGAAGGLPPDGRPAFVAFDHPASSPMRWTRVVPAVAVAAPMRDAQPRGPPTLV